MQASSSDRAGCDDDGESAGSSVDPLTQLGSLQSDALIRYGARLIVIGEVLEAILVSLAPAARAEVRAGFGARMKKASNEPCTSNLPDCYHSTIAAEVSHFVEALR
ncbi:hypothetical protein [Paraburkholderia caribensis]|nr:hypothetical protein [Paraburkholderia caribensis]